MGQTTPNIGIYVPAAGEINIEAPFVSGMTSLDNHDHSGAPNKGVPITSLGIATGAITRDKLNADVVLPGGGLAVDLANPNALKVDGILDPLFNLATNGLVTKKGALNIGTSSIATTAVNTINVAFNDGIAGNPTLSLPTSPAFLVYLANNVDTVTGAGTSFKIPFDTIAFDTFAPVFQFDIPSSTFTCIESGVYQFNVTVTLKDIDATMTKGNLRIFSNSIPGIHECFLNRNNPSTVVDADGYCSYSGSISLVMIAGFSAQIWVQIFGAVGNTAGIAGATNFVTYFSVGLIR